MYQFVSVTITSYPLNSCTPGDHREWRLARGFRDTAHSWLHSVVAAALVVAVLILRTGTGRVWLTPGKGTVLVWVLLL